jgi:tRNA pseudouridine38-40 synthase
MRSLRMTIAYDGTRFAGWQRQTEGRTVQGEMERTLKQVTGEQITVTASGRTDAGVHALAQVVGFHTGSRLAKDVLLRALNAEFPDDIVAFEITDAPEDFDPIRDAVRKRYRYVIKDGRLPDLFSRNYLWHVRQKLNVSAMQEAAKGLLGTHDFSSFETNGSSRISSVRTVFDILVERRAAEFTEHVIVEVEADGFLYNMVRNIVGTLVRVGRGQQPAGWPTEVLVARDRTRAGMAAPAQGLFMLWVKYEV